ncbi:MAG: thioredoxin family protein [Gemmatimonadales bacterium]
MSDLDWGRLWRERIGWEEFLTPTMDLALLWNGEYRRAVAPTWAVERLGRGEPLRFLMLTHDWCWDAAITLPWLVRLVEAVPGNQFGFLLRDEHPEVMDQFLTNGTRSIPIVFALRPDATLAGHWGPRPAVLQAWVRANIATMPKDQRYIEMRKWYLKDRGESTLREVLAAIGR